MKGNLFYLRDVPGVKLKEGQFYIHLIPFLFYFLLTRNEKSSKIKRVQRQTSSWKQYVSETLGEAHETGLSCERAHANLFSELH